MIDAVRFGGLVQEVALWGAGLSLLVWLLCATGEGAVRALERLPVSVRVAMVVLAAVTGALGQKSEPNRTARTRVVGSTADDAVAEVSGRHSTGLVRMESVAALEEGLEFTVGLAAGLRLVDDMLYVQGTSDLASGMWYDVLSREVDVSDTNLLVEVRHSDYPDELKADGALFRVVGDAVDLWTDVDADGVPDYLEALYGTDSADPDTDGDGVSDGEELEDGTDPTVADSDGDGVGDGDEKLVQTDPLLDDAPLPVPEGAHFEMTGTNVYMTEYAAANGQGGRSAEGRSLGQADEDDAVSVGGISFYESWADPFVRTGSGAYFRPLHSGRFTFKMREADDTAEVSIGDCSVTGSWGGPKPEASALMVAGRDYPISVRAENAGGPAELTFEKWGEFRPVRRIGLRNAFSAPIVIFERGFRDRHGNRPSRHNSTPLVLRMVANGGAFGGVLTVRTENVGRLKMKAGGPLPTSVEIPAGESRTWNIACMGYLPSDQENDIKVIAQLSEYQTGETLVVTAEVTAVRVSVAADANFPREKCRHKFGVAERVTLSQAPNTPLLLQDMSLCDGGWVRRQGSAWAMHVPHAQCEYAIPLNSGSVEFSLDFAAVAPTRTVLTDVHLIGSQEAYQINSQNAGVTLPILLSGDPGVLMSAKCYLVPTDVNFSSLNVFEGYAPPVRREGCYLDLVKYPDSQLAHDASAGAGSVATARPITGTNYWQGGDTAGGWLSRQDSYASGSYSLDIPVYWFVRGADADPTVSRMEDSVQKVSVSADGTMSVEKQGKKVSRPLTFEDERE